MGRRTVIIVSATIILVFTVVLYFTGGNRKTFVTDPYSAVAENACFVIETVDLLSFLNSLTTGTGLLGEIGKIEEFSGFNNKIRYITDNINKAEIRNLISGGRAVISFYPDGNGKLQTLLSMALPAGVRYKGIRQALGSAGIDKISETNFGKTTVLFAPYSNNTDTAFFTFRSGLLLAGNSGKLVKESFSAMESGTDIRRLTGFAKILLASGNNEDKIFVVFRNLTDILKPLFLPERSETAASLVSIASAGGGDLYINDDGIAFSGFIESSDPSERLHGFISVNPAGMESYRILPAGTALFETRMLQAKRPVIKADPANKISMLAASISEYLDDEITRAFTGNRGNELKENVLIIYELNNPVQAEQSLLRCLGSTPAISWFEPDDQIRIPVYHAPGNGLLKALFPEYAALSSDSLITFYDKYMITGSSYSAISKLLYDNLLNNTLANDLVYRDFESSLPSRSGYCLYFVPSKMIDYLDGYLNGNIINAMKKNRQSLARIQAAGYQLASSNGMIYNSLSVKFRDEVREESLSEWETLLDTTASIKPFFFTNHLTGAKEIFVQDLKNNIYLINAAGRVLWKAPLRERIEGTIYMIDFYRNGKFQLLFNGKNYLHLIDRNGNYVERYPVKLRSAATNSLALFDYDNNRNYRLLIAGEDRMIYAYDKSGNVVKGWKPFRTAGTVRTQMSYFRVSGKDYLAASDENSLYLLDRYGNRRVNFKEPVTRAPGSALKLNSVSEPYLICSSNEGRIQHIYFDGSVKKFDVRKFTAGHSMDIFDVDGDGFDEFIFIDEGKLYLYDHTRTELFTRDFGSNRLGGPITFSFSAEDKKIGVLDADKNLVYLLNKKGAVMNGFPLKGASMFSIGRLSDKDSWNLIVGGPDRFLYNYKIGNGT